MFSASHVLDEVSSVCDVRITTLKIINTSRNPFEMLAVASFVNLKSLYISPHNIGPDLVMCFGILFEFWWLPIKNKLERWNLEYFFCCNDKTPSTFSFDWPGFKTARSECAELAPPMISYC